MKVHPWLQIVLWLGLVLLGLTAMFSFTFFGTAWIYTVSGRTPPAFLAELINFLCGICVALCRHAQTITCTMRDTGIGIAGEDQIHIFERFYKADQARQRSKEGSGLGLSIVKKIVEMHCGTIKLESAPGTGTTFFVSLPIQ